MELQQILVYDKQHYFFRFLKYQFDKDFKFKKIKNDEDLNNWSKYSIAIFVMYSESEFMDFLKLYGNGVQILVCAYNEKILKKMENIGNIILLDTSKTKIEMVKELRDFFDCLAFQNAQILKYNKIQNN